MAQKFLRFVFGVICHKILTYTAFSKIHLAVPACCAGIYRAFSKRHGALHTYYTLHRHLMTLNNKYKCNDFNMRSINLFSLFKSDIWLKRF